MQVPAFGAGTCKSGRGTDATSHIIAEGVSERHYAGCPFMAISTEVLDAIGHLHIQVFTQGIKFPTQLRTAIDHSITHIVSVLFSTLNHLRQPISFIPRTIIRSLGALTMEFQSPQDNANELLASAAAKVSEFYGRCSHLERVTSFGKCKCRNLILQSCMQIVTAYNKCTAQLLATIQVDLSLLAGKLATSFPLESVSPSYARDIIAITGAPLEAFQSAVANYQSCSAIQAAKVSKFYVQYASVTASNCCNGV